MAGVPNVRLVIEVFEDNASNHGPGKCVGIVWDALKAGWSWYSRFPASAFWTLKQSSLTNLILRPLLTHARVWYVNDSTGYFKLVFNGRITERDSSGDDVIWTAYNYLADLSLSLTGYRKMYPKAPLATTATIGGKTVKGIVHQEWEQDDASGKYADYGARVAPHSILAHVATGTLENPTNAPSFTIITDSQFGVIDVPRLLLFFDLSEMGRANTTHNVSYEISRSITPVFNFWKDRGTRQAARRLTFPGTIRDYRYVPGFQSLRNYLATVGASADATGKAEVKSSDAASILAYGLRQDVFTIKTLVGYPNIDVVSAQVSAQQAITDRAVKEAASLGKNLQLDVHYSQMDPFDGWDLEDRVPVEIHNGVDDIDDDYRIVGVRGTLDGGGYRQSLFVNLPVT